MSLNQAVYPVSTYKIVDDESPAPGYISASRAGALLARIWGGTARNGYEGIWTGKEGKGYTVGEHIYCAHPQCNTSDCKFDERSISVALVPNEVRNNDNAATQLKVVRDVYGDTVVGEICNNPAAHLNYASFFWRERRGAEYIKAAIQNQPNHSLISLVSVPFFRDIVAYWSIVYQMPGIDWLSKVSKPTIFPTGDILYYDTIGRDTRIRSGLAGWLYKNIVVSYAMLDQMEHLIPVLANAEAQEMPIIFRTSTKEGRHVLAFAHKFFDHVSRAAVSSCKEGREFYLLRGLKIPQDIIKQSSSLPGAKVRLERLQRLIQENNLVTR